MAIKRLNVDDTPPGFAKDLAREAYLWLRLGRHTNILELYAVTWAMAAPALVLEFAPKSLREELSPAGRRATVSETVLVAIAVLRALQHAQGRLSGFWHGDIKPENIMLGQDGTYKLTDFGLAAALTPAGALTASHRAGTPAYMPPEVWTGDARGVASDVYSLGCTLYEMLTGRLYLRSSPLRSLKSLRNLDAVAPPSLVALITDCLRKRPTGRPSIDQALASALAIAKEQSVDVPLAVTYAESLQDLLGTAAGLRTLGAVDDALRVLDDADRMVETMGGLTDNELLTLHLARGETHALAGSWHSAEQSLMAAERIITIDTADWERAAMLTLRAEVLQHGHGLVHDAIPLLAEAMELDPSVERSANLALAHRAVGDLGAAIAILEQVVQATIRLDLLQLLVECCSAQDQVSGGRAWSEKGLWHARRAVDLHPDSGVAHSLRCLMIVQRGIRSDEDVADFITSCAYAARDPAVHPTAFDIFLRQLRLIRTQLIVMVGSPDPTVSAVATPLLSAVEAEIVTASARLRSG